MYETLEGKNIILRKAKIEDTESMLKHIWSNEEVYKWMLFKPTFTYLDAIERCKRSIEFQKDHYAYFVALKTTNEAIGLCAMHEIENGIFEESGIAIGSSFQGKGYGKEIVSLLLQLAFDKLGAKEFRYSYFDNNIKSKALANHFGFSYSLKVQMIRPWDNSLKTIIITKLSKENYDKLKSTNVLSSSSI